MKSFIQRYFLENNQIKPILVSLFLLGLVQATFTNIGYDEAYYWRFSQDLDWGYFDHPPMVALMISMGSKLIPGTLGIRLMTIVMSLFTYYIIWLLIPVQSRDKKGSSFVFLLLILGSPLLNIYSFITTPDVPLIFFTALYLYLFQSFLSNKNLKTSLLLGLVMSCLIYSKYHGILVILVSVLSQPKLFKSPYFYLASILGAGLYFPHLWWQYQHDFVSFNYHLSYRSVLFEFKNVLMYVLNTILVLNPLLFPLFVYAYFKYGMNSGMHNKTYSIFIWGFLSFFAFTSFRGHVEPQWIVVVCIPLIVYFFQYLMNFPNLLGPFKKLAITSLIIILLARIFIMLPLNVKSEFHSRDAAYYEEIDRHAEGRPVVFVNTYTEASKYSYYTGNPTFSYNFITFRKNQFDLWDYHSLFHNKDVFFVLYPNLSRFDKIEMSNGDNIYTMKLDKMPVINNLIVEILEYDPLVTHGDDLNVHFKVYNPNDNDIIFDNTDRPIVWTLFFFHLDKERFKRSMMLERFSEVIPAHGQLEIEGSFSIGLPPGKYTMGIHAWPKDMFEITLSKRTYPLEVTE